MRLWDYLRQANYLPQGAPDFLLGTEDVQRWVNQNKGELRARDDAIVDKIIMAILTRRGVKKPRLVLHAMADHAAGMIDGQAGRGAFSREITACAATTVATGDPQTLGVFRRAVHSAVAVGLNMSDSPYPVCRLYYVAKPTEIDEGMTWDFVNKHVSLSDRSKKTAKMTAFRRANVAGNAPPASSTIDAEAWDDLQREVHERNEEFIATYEAIADYYVERVSHYEAAVQRPLGNFDLIDGVTFVSKKKYLVHNFTIPPRGQPVAQGQKEQYFRFSMSFSADGKGWAIHHYAGGRDDRRPEDGQYIVSRAGSSTLKALDEGTYFTVPFRF